MELINDKVKLIEKLKRMYNKIENCLESLKEIDRILKGTHNVKNAEKLTDINNRILICIKSIENNKALTNEQIDFIGKINKLIK